MGRALSPAVAGRRAQSECGRRRRALFELLHPLEQGAHTGVLRLHVQGEPIGMIVVQEGRLCFASAAARPTPPAPLARLALQARASGATFCETLLSEPVDTVTRMRAELEAETTCALRALADCASRLQVTRRLDLARGGYDERLTFSAADLYAAVLRLDEPPGRDAVMDVFDGFRLSGDRGLLLSREPGDESVPYPVASYGLPGATLQELISLCRCVGELMRPAPFMGGMVEPTYAALRGEEGRQWVCLGQGRHVALIERHDGADLAPVIARSLRLH